MADNENEATDKNVIKCRRRRFKTTELFLRIFYLKYRYNGRSIYSAAEENLGVAIGECGRVVNQCHLCKKRP